MDHELVLILSDESGVAFDIVGPFATDLERQDFINEHPQNGLRWHARSLYHPDVYASS